MDRREFLMGLSILVAGTPEARDGTWVRRAAMPFARSETPATVLDGKIYVAGGFGAGARADRYDPDTDEWQRLADLPVETNHPGIVVREGRVILAGGYAMDGASAYSGMWAYDPDADSWEAIGELPGAMGAFGLATVDGDLYLVGGALGMLGGEPTASVWRWLPRDGTWEARAPLAQAREHLAVVAVEESIYAVGGRAHGKDSDQLGSAVERYDPATDTWDLLAPLPHPRSGLSGARVCETVIVIGGETSTRVFADVQMLSADGAGWASLPDLPVAVHGVAVASVNNRLFAIGGSTVAGRIQNVSATYQLDVGTTGSTCAS
jgi:N-acetylneuraminic acid mutarotase